MSNTRREQITKDLRVALLTNSLSPHSLPLCERIKGSVREFRAFVSAESDRYHNFPRPQASFAITVQRSFNLLRFRSKRQGFSVTEELHLPFDTCKQLGTYKPDVIISCQLGARTLFAVLYRLAHPRTRLIVWAALSSHTESRRSQAREVLRRWMLRHADGAFVNGASGESYLRKLGFERGIYTIPYTIDGTIFRSPQPYEPQPRVLRLLYCGRIEPYKGILPFTRALHQWCSRNPSRSISFELVGDGCQSEAIRSLPAVPNLKLRLLPQMGQHELASHYHEADIFVLPSLCDEWGVVVNEAMTAGLPVLGSIYSQAALELVQDGSSGWLFDPLNEDSVRNSLNRALEATPEQLKQMSDCALDRIAQITPSIISGRALHALAEVCNLEPASWCSPTVESAALLESAHR